MIDLSAPPVFLPPVFAFGACVLSGVTNFGDGVFFIICWDLWGQYGTDDGKDYTYAKPILYSTLLPLASIPTLVYVAWTEMQLSVAYSNLLSFTSAISTTLGVLVLLFVDARTVTMIAGCIFFAFTLFKLIPAIHKLGLDRTSKKYTIMADGAQSFTEPSNELSSVSQSPQGIELKSQRLLNRVKDKATSDTEVKTVEINSTNNPLTNSLHTPDISTITAPGTTREESFTPQVNKNYKSSLVASVEVSTTNSLSTIVAQETNTTAVREKVKLDRTETIVIDRARLIHWPSFERWFREEESLIEFKASIDGVGGVSGGGVALQTSPTKKRTRRQWVEYLFPQISESLIAVETVAFWLFICGIGSGFLGGVIGTGSPAQLIAFSQLDLTKGSMRGVKVQATIVSNLIRLLMIIAFGGGKIFILKEWPIYLTVCLASLLGATFGTWLRLFINKDFLLILLYWLLWFTSADLVGVFKIEAKQPVAVIFYIGTLLLMLINLTCYYWPSKVVKIRKYITSQKMTYTA